MLKQNTHGGTPMGKPALAAFTFVLAAISLIGSLVTIWQAGVGNNELASAFFFFCSTIFIGSFCFVSYMAIRLHGKAERNCALMETAAKQLEIRLQEESAHRLEIIKWEKDKALQIARTWHELCHHERDALLNHLGTEAVFALLLKHCELVRQAFGSGYPNFDFHVTIKMFADKVTLVNVARDEAGIMQTQERADGGILWRDYDVRSSIDENGDSDFVLLTSRKELTPLDAPNRRRVWASDDLHCVQGCTSLPNGEPYRNKSKNYPCFYDATMVVPICKSCDATMPSGHRATPEFLGFLCVDTLFRKMDHPQIFGSYDRPNDTFAFVLRATADILYCILKSGATAKSFAASTISEAANDVVIDPLVCDFTTRLHQLFIAHAEAKREARRA